MNLDIPLASQSEVRRLHLALLVIFLLSLPLINPWVRGDGVGYYAYARAPLIQGNLDFERDYLAANSSFRLGRIGENGRPKPIFRTKTGHLDNHFTVGPAILWAPFLLLAHAGVLLVRMLGSNVAADGYSAPYRIAMALGTALYGFVGLLISFRLAREYVAPRWAFLATIGVWWASSLPIYMYFNPSWSHAHSAFAVAMFFWYWHQTRTSRTIFQWCVLGAIAGLMMNVYYANAFMLLVVGIEAIGQYAAIFRDARKQVSAAAQLALRHLLFFAAFLICLLPTFITRDIVYGSPLATGYVSLRYWFWRSPFFLAVLFSSDHGLFAWTPILLLAFAGLVLFARTHPSPGMPFLAAAFAFYIFIACYPDWAGISSYGNRFFVSLTPLFILGLAVFLERFARLFHSQRNALATASAAIVMFTLWNLAFMYQWGTHLIPPRGPISWREMAHNQLFVVPKNLSGRLGNYFFRRGEFMRQIEQRDLRQIEDDSSPNPPN